MCEARAGKRGASGERGNGQMTSRQMTSRNVPPLKAEGFLWVRSHLSWAAIGGRTVSFLTDAGLDLVVGRGACCSNAQLHSAYSFERSNPSSWPGQARA